MKYCLCFRWLVHNISEIGRTMPRRGQCHYDIRSYTSHDRVRSRPAAGNWEADTHIIILILENWVMALWHRTVLVCYMYSSGCNFQAMRPVNKLEVSFSGNTASLGVMQISEDPISYIIFHGSRWDAVSCDPHMTRTRYNEHRTRDREAEMNKHKTI